MIEAIRYFGSYLSKFKLKLSLVLVGVSFTMYFVVRQPELISEAINELAMMLMTQNSSDKFYSILSTILTFVILAFIFNLMQNFIMTKVAGDATHAMRTDLFRKLERLPIRFFDQSSDGDILSRFTSDLDNISNALNQAIHELLSNSAMLIITLVLMFQVHVELSFVALATTPLIIIVASTIIRKAQYHVKRQQRAMGKLNGFADERFTGQKLIIANGLEQENIEDFNVYNQKLYNETFKGQVYSNILFPSLQGLSMLANAIVIFYGAWMTSSGRLPLAQASGMIFLYTQYVRMVYQPLTQIANQFTQMQLAMTGANRIMEILREVDEYDRENVLDIQGIEGNVKLNNVSFSYDNNEMVLKNINITAQKGETIALVGHTGSGKTTIMNLLNRFYDIDQGEILFDGLDIRNISLPSLRRNVGIVLQDSIVFTGTIAANIAFGKPDATRDAIIEAAKQANIHDFIMTLEDQYDTQVSESNSKMSVGQKQLLSIARTMLTDPDLLILDEATSNVDTVTESQIQEAMDLVTQNRTSFVIAHRLKTILRADKIVVLQQGEIIEEGSHQKLLNDKGHYAMLYENQFVQL